MKKYIYIIGAILLASICQVTAQTATDARTLLDGLSRKFAHSNGAVISFAMHSSQGNQVGTLSLKGEKFLLNTGDMKTWFDGKTQWTYLVANDEVTISEPTPDELLGINPYAWLSLYKQGYRLKLEKKALKEGVTMDEITMTAVDKEAVFVTVQLSLSPLNGLPALIRLMPRGDDPVLIAVHNTKMEPLSDVFFRFDKREYPTAEIIDLR